ncbi:MAG: D-2-hydroxyacid dehydrogenase [Actinomycetia bacterium]|nr:D-2-hydroxyacid dehydrogenase [Actinomycetes bacterium]
MKQVLFCTDHFIREHRDRLAAVAPQVDVIALDAAGAISADDLARVTIAFMSKDTWPKLAKPFTNVVETAPHLEWFHIFSAGAEGPIFETLRERGVRVTRSAGASANAIAETVFMFLHGLARDVRGVAQAQAQHRFEWHEWAELEGRTIAVLGYGPIGQRITQVALAYGMRPTIVRQRVRGDEPCPTRTLGELEEVAAQHDVMVLALPLTAETQGVVTRGVIERMPAHALFVNVARGALVDQTALTEVLAAGRIAGAGLDVFETEPLPAADPLWDLPNVLITPHNSGSSFGGPRAVVEIFFANLALYLAGEPMNYELPR